MSTKLIIKPVDLVPKQIEIDINIPPMPGLGDKLKDLIDWYKKYGAMLQRAKDNQKI